MKNFILLIAFFGSSHFIFAQTSSLNIFSEEGLEFYLVLNGIRQNENSETNVRVENLTNDYYSAKIVFKSSAIPEIEKATLLVVDPDSNHGDVTYKIKTNKKGVLKLRYFSFTPYQEAQTIPDDVTVINYNTSPMPDIDVITTSTQTTTTTTYDDGDSENISMDVDVNIGGNTMGMNVEINAEELLIGETDAHYTETSSTTTTTTTSTNSNIESSEEVFINSESDCYLIDDTDFQNALESIRSKSFDDSRVTIAKQVAQSNCLKAVQIKKIMSVLEFEDSKLEFAKFAHKNCYNPENYFMINDAFDFDSSIDELDEYIKSKN